MWTIAFESGSIWYFLVLIKLIPVSSELIKILLWPCSTLNVSKLKAGHVSFPIFKNIGTDLKTASGLSR